MTGRATNPFEDAGLAQGYESWYRTTGRRASRLEKRLLGRLLASFAPTASILEVGCGTGHFTRWAAERHPVVVGVDRSLAMLSHADRIGRQDLVAADAAALPVPDASFDVVLLVTVLEFLERPSEALREASRVARRGIVVGALNRRSLLGRRLANADEPPWTSARLPTVRGLIRLVRDSSQGRRPRVMWRTTLWPIGSCSLPLPWGDFIGLAARWTEPAGPSWRSR